ncbi:MAG: NADH-quinone oxidoreductase subunit J [Planctomycetota bacterium]
MNVWIQQYPLTLIGLLLWALGIILLMPNRNGTSGKPSPVGLGLTGFGLVAFLAGFGRTDAALVPELLFWIFASGALAGGVLMITARNPVYGALWFAVATLCTCGLFLTQSAPFLAAATVIVYAGAVIVTFLFVIMLARQSGSAGYDQKSQNAVVACLSAFLLIGAITKTLQTTDVEISRQVTAVAEPKARPGGSAVSSQPQNNLLSLEISADAGQAPPEPDPIPNYLSKADATTPVGSLRGLGRSLFSDYLFAVEIAGTLLLVASIGAIAIAPRREEGAL